MNNKKALPVNKKLKGFATNGRTNQTPEEKRVWYDYLSKVTPRFHRQRIIGNYIVDFYCPKLRVVIEIDGYQHFYEESREYDKKRTEYLECLGFVVLRFENTEVNKDFEQVKFEIKEFCEQRAKAFDLEEYNFIIES
jgi:very-short-patch-repair endonuclease